MFAILLDYLDFYFISSVSITASNFNFSSYAFDRGGFFDKLALAGLVSLLFIGTLDTCIFYFGTSPPTFDLLFYVVTSLDFRSSALDFTNVY